MQQNSCESVQAAELHRFWWLTNCIITCSLLRGCIHSQPQPRTFHISCHIILIITYHVIPHNLALFQDVPRLLILIRTQSIVCCPFYNTAVYEYAFVYCSTQPVRVLVLVLTYTILSSTWYHTQVLHSSGWVGQGWMGRLRALLRNHKR